ncbi:sulfoxide reductase heme-binding subunit YedZ [Corallococcus praedator]|uniref:Protein-methionine-sulfoxide reductase heme-binding subunit MsrQ n=1 Tax=Corallococcus praedator TaxID=2316724 RepID=A0ABX9QM52_9BACT|nr:MULTISPECIES: protein-methionine-sulfoxide reductase heme-binding subunit MsrQ [Corallococcus]RKG98851.1 sulfoxide reductase heme-binding subunit YedZ [Corallococcus sp. CA047B]RKH32056.1 sulfoxide reductase heme-binding subunit YedZ [Corallococcus sp. CA031C]RKI13233.1 sulfoxide reductase heme-binding subunit YedZ [Corallococcus praedator]
MASKQPWLNPAVALGGLSPLALLAVQGAQGQLGANGIEFALNQTGLFALAVLMASLACTPLRLITGWTWPARIRRTLGLLAFTYAGAHFLTYSVLDQGLDVRAMVEDVLTRPFITVGFTAFMLLVPLALTSTNKSVRRLGFPKWQRLHRLAYVAAMLGVVHFIWRVKKDVTEPVLYGAVLALLLAVRVGEALRKKRALAAQRTA